MEQKEIMIRLKGITKAFPQKKGTLEVLHGIDLDIEKGEIFGIIGLSGAGKSTLVRCINLLERPTEGQVYLDGQELTCLSEKDLRQARRSMGMIFQQFHLLMQRTAMENVCFPMEIAGVKRRKPEKRQKNCWNWLVWVTEWNLILPSFPAVRNRGLPLPEHWPQTPKSCFVTKQQARLTPTQQPGFWNF